MKSVQHFAIRMQALLALAATVAMAAPKDWPPVPADKVEKIKAALPAKAEPQAAPRKLLVFYLTEGFTHGSIPVANECYRQLGEKTGAFTVTFSQDYSVFTPESLAQYDAILFNNTTGLKMNANPAHLAALLDFVNKGKGLVGVHAASDNFNCCKDASDMLGGAFDGHPWGAGGTWRMKLDDPDHPLNRGFKGQGFDLKDEIYQIKGHYSHATERELVSLDMKDDRNWKVNTNGIHRADLDFPISWIKPYGKGRVFYCSMGHNEEVYWNKAVVQHYLDGIQYAIGDFKVDDRPTAEARKN